MSSSCSPLKSLIFRLQRYSIPIEIGTQKSGFFGYKKSAVIPALIMLLIFTIYGLYAQET